MITSFFKKPTTSSSVSTAFTKFGSMANLFSPKINTTGFGITLFLLQVIGKTFSNLFSPKINTTGFGITLFLLQVIDWSGKGRRGVGREGEEWEGEERSGKGRRGVGRGGEEWAG